MPDKAFLDTNILLYAFSEGDPRQHRSLELLMTGGAISIQSLNEFANVARRKMKASWPEVLLWLSRIRKLCDPPIPMNLTVHERGIQIAQGCGYGFYDSLMLAAAIEADCTIFYSEDLHHGHKLGDLTIRNPFR